MFNDVSVNPPAVAPSVIVVVGGKTVFGGKLFVSVPPTIPPDVIVNPYGAGEDNVKFDPGTSLYEIAVTGNVSPFDHVYEFPFGNRNSKLSAWIDNWTGKGIPLEYPVVAVTCAVNVPNTIGVP
jgi:hypothetical protein